MMCLMFCKKPIKKIQNQTLPWICPLQVTIKPNSTVSISNWQYSGNIAALLELYWLVQVTLPINSEWNTFACKANFQIAPLLQSQPMIWPPTSSLIHLAANCLRRIQYFSQFSAPHSAHFDLSTQWAFTLLYPNSHAAVVHHTFITIPEICQVVFVFLFHWSWILLSGNLPSKTTQIIITSLL